ncbi:MAG: pilus (MSHA type) biogenesis protein MshL [Microbacteriaceae bacterium]|nr:pilus (MSHA type) biogenesis protein MshL [Burkholderiaceae bacterium]
MLRPVARRDRAPTVLAMAAWTPPAAAAQPTGMAAAAGITNTNTNATATATTADTTTAGLVPAQVMAAATTLPLTRAPTQLTGAPSRMPAPPPVAEPRFDLSINSAPAAQVFLQLAQGSAYNMLVSPDVSGTLSITLKDTTVLEALDTLRELFGYEFRVTGNRIFIYPNTVQTRLYRINYLPGRRQGASDIRVSSSAITTSGAGASTTNSGSGSSSTSSGPGNRPHHNAHVRTTSGAHFWREVQSSLAALVGAAGGRSVVLNPAAGVVVIKATPAELRQVEQYLKAVQISIERQVMLEAKIVEVSLSKDAQTGINWAAFGKLGSGQLTFGSAAPGTKLGNAGELSSGGNAINPGVGLAASALGRGFYGLAFQAANFAALLNFLETQGDVQVLSSPRIATLNNQKAVLKVGSDELYVTGISSNTTSNGASTVTTPTLTLQPFFSGISLDVTPQIDDAGNVMLHVHPTISRVTEKNKDIDLGTQGVFRLPLASSAVNETDSIVRVKDGQIVAIGGLMKTELRDERTGLPVVGDMPVVGGLFRQTSTIVSKRELVIMLKPTIIHEDGSWPDAPAFSAAPMQPPLAAAKP